MSFVNTTSVNRSTFDRNTFDLASLDRYKLYPHWIGAVCDKNYNFFTFQNRASLKVSPMVTIRSKVGNDQKLETIKSRNRSNGFRLNVE